MKAPPYGSHLTVIDHSRDDADYHGVHEQFVTEADRCVPIESEIREVLLLVEGADGYWTTRNTFNLI